jgi:hypothetical protein
MKRTLLIAFIAVIMLGCGEKPKESTVWREDFRIERLPWQTILGTRDWMLDQGVWVILGKAPFVELAIVDRDWKAEDYQINTSLRLNEKGEAGVVLGYKDEKDFWRITLDHSQNRIALIKRTDGKDSVMAEGSISLSHREFHALVIDVTKTLIKVRCDDLTVFETGRPAGIEGRLGIFAGIAAPPNTPIYANFDNFEVKPVP